MLKIVHFVLFSRPHFKLHFCAPLDILCSTQNHSLLNHNAHITLFFSDWQWWLAGEDGRGGFRICPNDRLVAYKMLTRPITMLSRLWNENDGFLKTTQIAPPPYFNTAFEISFNKNRNGWIQIVADCLWIISRHIFRGKRFTTGSSIL